MHIDYIITNYSLIYYTRGQKITVKSTTILQRKSKIILNQALLLFTKASSGFPKINSIKIWSINIYQ